MNKIKIESNFSLPISYNLEQLIICLIGSPKSQIQVCSSNRSLDNIVKLEYRFAHRFTPNLKTRFTGVRGKLMKKEKLLSPVHKKKLEAPTNLIPSSRQRGRSSKTLKQRAFKKETESVNYERTKTEAEVIYEARRVHTDGFL